MSKVLKIVAQFQRKYENLGLLLSLYFKRPARQSLAHKAAQKLSWQLVDTKIADRWRSQNQADLDNSHLTLTKKKSQKKEELNVIIKTKLIIFI